MFYVIFLFFPRLRNFFLSFESFSIVTIFKFIYIFIEYEKVVFLTIYFMDFLYLYINFKQYDTFHFLKKVNIFFSK